MPFFFFNDTATTEIYTLSLHDALPISLLVWRLHARYRRLVGRQRTNKYRPWITLGIYTVLLGLVGWVAWGHWPARSEEHTSELQSQSNLVCRLLLAKKKPLGSPPERAS